MPYVSVIIPAQNRPAMLREAIASVLAQTFQDFELIVVLNGATPETADVAKSFANNPKIKVAPMEKSTLADARNTGLSVATGEWLAFLDDDDIWLPSKIDVQLKAAAASGADLVTCDFSAFNQDGEIAGAGLYPLPPGLSFAEALVLSNYVSGGSAAMARSAAVRRLGGFDATLHACEDWDMWRRLAWDGKIHYVDQRLVRYRRHGSNMTGDMDLLIQAEMQHFAKLLLDTPPNLRHMLQEAKRQFFWRLSWRLGEQGILDTYKILAHNVVFSAWRIVTKLVRGSWKGA